MTFPRLRTDAIAQYPLRSRIDYATRILVHVDGSEQRFPEFKAEARTWVVSLERLTDEELATLREFFRDVHTSNSAFEFTDADGIVHTNCCFAEDEFETVVEGEVRLTTRLTIRRN